jgi:hypothetical protein
MQSVALVNFCLNEYENAATDKVRVHDQSQSSETDRLNCTAEDISESGQNDAVK